MNMAGDDLLAGAGLSGNQDAGLGGRDLFGTAHCFEHDRVARDKRMGFARGCLEDSRNQIGIGRQRQELARAPRASLAAPTVRPRRSRKRPTGVMMRSSDMPRTRLPTSCGNSTSTRSTLASARKRESAVRSSSTLLQLGAARGGDPRCLAKLAAERSEDQNLHDRRLRSVALDDFGHGHAQAGLVDQHYSPRATRRLLT